MSSAWVRKLVLAVVAVCACAAVPASASAAIVSGSVTAAGGGGAIDAIEVCATPVSSSFEDLCTQTNGLGQYTLAGLPAASYKIRFRETHNRNYVDQYFDGAGGYLGAEVVTLAATDVRTGVDAELEPGGTIAGLVIGAGGPVADYLVCAFATTTLGEVGRCWRTNEAGEYRINGLPPEDYTVEFLPEDKLNFLPQYYNVVNTAGEATPVTIGAAGEQQTAIDASLVPGAEVTGLLTEAVSGKPLAGIDVVLLKPVSEQVLGTVRTDAAGRYAFRGRPSGIYLVGFRPGPAGPVSSECFPARYYKGASTAAAATPLEVVAPSVTAGVDGELASECLPRPQPVQVTFVPASPPPPALRCKKNQRKKWVRGKYRCVKKPRKHRRHHRHGKGHGPRAVATDR